MKSLRNHLSVIIPLFVTLFSLQFIFLINQIVDSYSRTLTKDYSIVVVASKELSQTTIKNIVSGVKSIEEISSKKILDKLKDKISTKNISLLKTSLPKFYSIKLKSFPNEKDIEEIKDKLLKIESITKVETFSKTYSKIYRMFQALEKIVFLFSIFVLIISVLLMVKQMKIWLLEHQERMSIMTLFGAPFWIKSAVLYRLVVIDSLISTLLVSAVYIFIPKFEKIDTFAKSIDIVIPEFFILKDTGVLLIVSLLFSLFIVSIVIRKMNRQ
ncbi:MAG: ABC transporter permease [Sulfurospirillum sp.]|nr:ABC transporter permease [Sulfurospirillum sp.]MBL0703344.1 ABC transporter permease [Sulfurospirillum sp.]